MLDRDGDGLTNRVCKKDKYFYEVLYLRNKK